MVIARSTGHCEAMRGGCQIAATEFHHRVNRGMGCAQRSGGPESCLHLCRACHQWVTVHPKHARELGYSVLRNSIADPAEVRVRWRQRWVLLDAHGGKRDASREAA